MSVGHLVLCHKTIHTRDSKERRERTRDNRRLRRLNGFIKMVTGSTLTKAMFSKYQTMYSLYHNVNRSQGESLEIWPQDTEIF